ncbi:hypothetical protein LOD99_15635 [Oopsacas minuta]|uniref:Superoxide dismutase copper/zinc binding domain-containing protein n=1 Tax=Oopsacas minuta TaxID=111878 RepID=A0AAV7K9I7_9METZ|nr:hypothetical protein LOD99_15635 [Oopsacas minuta]
MLILSLTLLFAALYSINAQGIARFDTRSLNGYIIFTELENGSLEIMGTFENLPFDYSLPYHVHVYPVDYRYDPAVRCGALYTGGHYDPTGRLAAAGDSYREDCMADSSACEIGDLSGIFGPISNGTFTHQSSDLSLNGPYGILYRSIVIHRVDAGSTPRYVCATIEPMNDLASSITARAAFYGNIISGNIYFFQQDADSVSTKIFVDLNTVNTERDLENLDWNIYNSPPGVRSRRGDCTHVGELYNPRRRNVDSCDNRDARTCPEYALTEKHGDLTVTSDGNKFFFTEVRGITLSGSNSIIGRSITISRGNEIIACAAIGVVSAIRLRAVLSDGYVISATQYFPFSSSRISTTGSRGNINRLELQERGYINGVCDGSATRYNPFVINVENRGTTTPDSNPLGDLLEQIPSDGATLMTSPIPLSGVNSAADRTVWYQIGERTGCTSFTYDLTDRSDNAFVVRANATFVDRSITCMVFFSQLVTGVSYRPTFGERPSNPNFQSGDVLITDLCTNDTDREYRFIMDPSGQCGVDYYNPYNVRRQSTDRVLYDQDCDRREQRRCTVGNNLGQTTSDSMRSYVNTNLELAGYYGIASGEIRVQVDGSYCAQLQVIGETSAVYSVNSCEQFNNRLGNAIDTCAGVESNNFLPISCSDDDINEVDNTVTVNVNTVFPEGTDTEQVEACILASISSGNKLAGSTSIFLMIAIIILLIV